MISRWFHENISIKMMQRAIKSETKHILNVYRFNLNSHSFWKQKPKAEAEA